MGKTPQHQPEPETLINDMKDMTSEQVAAEGIFARETARRVKNHLKHNRTYMLPLSERLMDSKQSGRS